MANIQDVADAAGVSTASVSRFLAGQKVRTADAIRAAGGGCHDAPLPGGRDGDPRGPGSEFDDFRVFFEERDIILIGGRGQGMTVC